MVFACARLVAQKLVAKPSSMTTLRVPLRAASSKPMRQANKSKAFSIAAESASLSDTARLAATVYFQTGKIPKLQICPAKLQPPARQLRFPARVAGAALEIAPESGEARRRGPRAQSRFSPCGSRPARRVPPAPAAPRRPPRTRAAAGPGERIRIPSLPRRTVRTAPTCASASTTCLVCASEISPRNLRVR